jgi:signal transduction histidine kinase
MEMTKRLFESAISSAHAVGEEFEFEYCLRMPVTQRRLLGEVLSKAQSELASVLTASIAHEVKQPLAAIVTNAESSLRWLARDKPDIEKARALAIRMAADARRASEIIDRISETTKQRTFGQRSLSLNNIVNESLDCIHHELQLNGIVLSLDLSQNLPRVFGDRTDLQQVIVNLVINAMQAMAKVAPTDRGISVRTQWSGSQMVCCAVEDSGPGIDKEHLPLLFESFFTTKNTGMGLGLAICRSIVEAHGGRIRADNRSALGGARFSFDLRPSLATA